MGKIEAVPDFPKLEEDVLSFWEKENIFKKSLKLHEGKKPFVFFEGPPTANGRPGIHHVLARSFKDLYPRFKTMCGHYCERRGGWDTHGLPVEIEVEKSLKISGKKQIEQYGIAEFNQKCKESVLRYVNDWERLTKRMGFWIDLEHPYLTMSNEFIESVWWVLKKFFTEGLLTKDYKVVPYCPRCGTSLSSHELAQGYADVEDTSVYVKFQIKGQEKTFLLAWTTTPWTLPGNVALAVNPEADYVYVKTGEETLILAEAMLSVLGETKYEVLRKVKGEDLVNLDYEPLYQFIKYDQKAYYVVPADFVSLDDGTGIVHTAVMYGEDDFILGNKLGLPKKHIVDSEGKFIAEAGQFAGKFVKDADREIISDLNTRGLLFKEEKITHSYPFCWRCHGPLLYYAQSSWYVLTTKQKEKLIAENISTNWTPNHLKAGRMGNWLETLIDWNLSRNRYWGTPLPVWECPKCGKTHCVGSLEELKSLADPDDWQAFEEKGKDLHRPWVDRVKIKCPDCGSWINRVSEVIDVWFDSGSMPFAQWHYPFENQDKVRSFDELRISSTDNSSSAEESSLTKFKAHFPADFISEAIDQTRGWFYSLLAVNTLSFGQNAYKNVVCTGFVLDEKGKKMSKHIGNVLDPWEIIGKTGIDVVRWYFYGVTTPGNDYRLGIKNLEEVRRRFLLILWNIFKFTAEYAQTDKLGGELTEKIEGENLTILDRWVLSKLNRLVENVTTNLENYDAFTATGQIEAFVSDLSTWYLRRSRSRVGPTSKNTKDKEAFYRTMVTVLLTLSKVIAPFIPFFAETLYQKLRQEFNLIDLKESVHLEDWPESTEEYLDETLEKKMELVRKVSEKGHAARKESGIKVRQPLGKFSIFNFQFSMEDNLKQLIKEELNVKEVVVNSGSEEMKVEFDTKLTPELKAEGEARELIRSIQELRKEKGCKLDDRISIEAPVWPEAFTQLIKDETLAEEITKSSGPLSITVF